MPPCIAIYCATPLATRDFRLTHIILTLVCQYSVQDYFDIMKGTVHNYIMHLFTIFFIMLLTYVLFLVAIAYIKIIKICPVI